MIRRVTRLLVLCLPLAGCVSTSSSTFADLDREHPKFQSQGCQTAADDTRIHDELKLIRMVASPVAVILSGGMLLPVVVANVGLDTVDRVDASRLEIHCGGEGKTATQIAEGVVTGAAIGLATGAAIGAAVGPVTPSSVGATVNSAAR